MPQITIKIDNKENKQIEIFKAEEGLKNKVDAIRLVIQRFFKIK